MLHFSTAGKHRLTAQVSKWEDFSPIEFYMKVFFIEVNYDHRAVKKIKQNIPRSTVVDDPSLVYVVIEIPFYLVPPWWVNTC